MRRRPLESSAGPFAGPAPRHVPRLLAVALAALALACSEDGGAVAGAPRVGPQERARVAASVADCARCHPQVVERFLGHGMAYTLGPVEQLPTGDVTHPASGDRYRFEGDRLVHERPDGGREVARVVGRYGAGVADTAHIGEVLDGEGRGTGRLCFLPLEDMRSRGPTLAPFEQHVPGTGLGMPFNAECLTCHSSDDPARLPGAAADTGGSGRIWPGHRLGADAFEHLTPLGCRTCHGEVAEHAAAMQRAARERDFDADPRIRKLGDLPAGRQRDLCARCHLQGDGRILLAPIGRVGPPPEDFLARRPTLVAATPSEDHRFVGQVRRLALSACFQASEMTCTTCHDPHMAVAAQGTADFDARCLDCHGGAGQGVDAEASDCTRPRDLTVADVTGHAGRTSAGCVDCHVRRSQPFDLAHVRTADHWIRRRPPPPSDDAHREWEDPGGPLAVFDDGRLGERLASGDGQRWEAGLIAVAAARAGDRERARELLPLLPPPGRATAATGAGAGLPPLQAAADFHHLRALAHEALGQTELALAAYGDALRVDPAHPQAGLNGAFLLHAAGEVQMALDEAGRLLERYPLAEKPWNLRYLAASGAGQLPYAHDAISRSLELWPNDPTSWQALGRLSLRAGLPDAARMAFEQAWRLAPSLPGLAADRESAGDG